MTKSSTVIPYDYWGTFSLTALWFSLAVQTLALSGQCQQSPSSSTSLYVTEGSYVMVSINLLDKASLFPPFWQQSICCLYWAIVGTHGSHLGVPTQTPNLLVAQMRIQLLPLPCSDCGSPGYILLCNMRTVWLNVQMLQKKLGKIKNRHLVDAFRNYLIISIN